MKELERETISGSTAIERRIDFIRLRDKLEAGDVLIVTKLDRLGRDAIDVSAKVAKLEELGVWVHCCAFCGVDLASSAGQMTMNVINKASLVAGLVQTSSGNTLVKTEICGDQKINGLPDRWLDCFHAIEATGRIKARRGSDRRSYRYDNAFQLSSPLTCQPEQFLPDRDIARLHFACADLSSDLYPTPISTMPV